MITDFLLNVLFSGINALLSLVPSVSIPDVGANQNYMSSMYALNRIVPVEWTAIVILAYFSTKVSLQVWDMIVFVYHQFWGGD
jgi:hypothetical protein